MTRPDSLERLPDLAADARRVARLALEEDGARDLTAEVAGDPERPASGLLVLRGRGVMAGLTYAEAVASEAGCAIEWMAELGQTVGSVPIGRISGTSRSVLRAERPLAPLENFLDAFPGRVLLAADSAGRREVLLEMLRAHRLIPAGVAGWHEFVESTSRFAMCVAPAECPMR